MKILAIETSTMLGGVAVTDGTTLIAESRINVKSTHSERLLTEIDHVLTRSGLTIRDIDLFAIAIGPGSFTGLRVGLSTVKGLVYATGARLVAVPSLEAFAWNLPFSSHPVCPLFDARRKEVYGGLFRWTGTGFVREIAERPIALADLLTLIQEPTVFIGEGAVIYREEIIGTLRDKALFAPPREMVPSPASVAHLAFLRAQRGEFDDPVSLIPLYLRRSEAEMTLGQG